MKQSSGNSNGKTTGHRSRQRPPAAAADSLLRRPDHGINPSGPSGAQNGRTVIEAHRKQILEHISSHRITFLQGETGCGKSTAVPQFILDNATARDRVRIIVTQPRRVAATSLAQYVASLRGGKIGDDVGYAVSHDRAASLSKTRLTFVTTGYLLEWLARDLQGQLDLPAITHIILDEVHVRSVDQDLLLLLLKLLLTGMGTHKRWSSLQATKLIIMSATMDARPLQEYLSCLLKTAPVEDPIIVRGRTFPVEIVHIDEILGYLPRLPKALVDLATRFVEISGRGERALDGTNLPHFAIELITGLVRQVGRADDCILVFVATFSDMCEIHQGFERVAKSKDGTNLPLEVFFLHSKLSSEEQDMAISPPRPGTLKVVLATNIAESSLTIPNVVVVFDLGHQVQIDYCISSNGKTSRVWCSKASARQRAGRTGRLFPGVVIRLYTRETFKNLPEFEKPDIALENLGSTILRIRSLFQHRFPNMSVVEIVQQLLDSTPPETLTVAMKELRAMGAITPTSSLESCELTLLGRLAIELSPDIHLARFVLLGVAMGCGVDCVIMAAGLSLPDDIFNHPLQICRDSVDPIYFQERRIANLGARMHFHGGYASSLLAYSQLYSEWVRSCLQSTSTEWMKSNEVRPSSLGCFLLVVRQYAERTIAFITREFGVGMLREVNKLRTLAAIDPRSTTKCARHDNFPNFCDKLGVVQMAITGAFSRNWLVGTPAKNLQVATEIRNLEQANMPVHLSFKLTNVPPDFVGPNSLKLEMALKVLGPIHKVVHVGGQVALVQCEPQQQGPLVASSPVILDLPYTARIAGYMAKAFSGKGELVISRKENLLPTAKVEELYLGRPSVSRALKWTVGIEKEVRKARFQRLSFIQGAVEVRKDIPFHIAVAVHLCHTTDTNEISASNVTVLPHDNLFCVLAILLFRPSGPEGELKVRLLSKSDRIYSIKYQGQTLELAPRFIRMETLEYVDRLRYRIQRFESGAEVGSCDLSQEMVTLVEYIKATEYGAPLLAPDLGLWCSYPTLNPVHEKKGNLKQVHKKKGQSEELHQKKGQAEQVYQEKGQAAQLYKTKGKPEQVRQEKDQLEQEQKKGETEQEREKKGKPKQLYEKKGELEQLHEQLKPGSQNETPGSAKVVQDTQSCPLLLQSRSDKKSQSHPQASDREQPQLNAEKLSGVQLFEQAFEEAELELNRTHLVEWIEGNRLHNGMFFELLKNLVQKTPGQIKHTMASRKAVLQFVYSKRDDLVNQKQRKEMEGLYHSICNPDQMDRLPWDAFGTNASKKVEVQKRKSQVQCEVVKSLTPDIIRQLKFNRQQIEAITSALRYQHFDAKITVGSDLGGGPGVVTVSGKSMDVEFAMRIIERQVNDNFQRPWEVDDTYIDSSNMDQHVHCVYADGFHRSASNVSRDKTTEFLLVRDTHGETSHDNSHAGGSRSLFHARMENKFERVLEERGKTKGSVQIQARLGRVIFACSTAFEKQLPFLDGQARPFGELRKLIDRHSINKRRFADTIPEKEFYHLRACLQLCHPSTVERYKSYILVVSNPRARDGKDKEGKLKLTDALDASGGFDLHKEERRTKLAVADIVRLDAGAIQVDVRLSMQVNKEKTQISAEARDYASKIKRKGSNLVFPAGPYIVQLQRHKDSEAFYFDGLKVTLVNVKQIAGGVTQSKHEVEFEATGSQLQVGKTKIAGWFCELTRKIPLILEQVQSVCSQMSWRGPSCHVTGVMQALLRSWTIERDEIKLKDILIREFLPSPSKDKGIGEDLEQVSMQMCSVIEVLCHCDGRILKEGIDVASELQLALLQVMQSMNISLSKSMEGRVKWFLSNHKLEPENALQYANLLKCHCSPLDRTWDSVLQPYVLQLILENQSEVLERLFSHFCHELSDDSDAQLVDATMRSSIWTTLSALNRLFQKENVRMFFKLFNVAAKCEETTIPAKSLVARYVVDLLAQNDLKAIAFVGKCLEWTVDNESSVVNWKIHMQNVFWLLEIIRMLDSFVDEKCRAKTLELLLRLPSSMERKRELEEALMKTYGVDETQFRNGHYQRVLKQLGPLQDAHKEELKRRGLDEKRCEDFNFRSWTPGSVRGRDVMGSSLIPGFNENGTRLVGSRGIFIPARDPYGQITGAQLKSDDNKTGKRKYVWLSSNNVFNGGKGPKIEGELPLFCCVPRESDTSLVGLCEGGLKAHVLAALSGLPVIGASGADFPRSKNLLQSYLVMMAVERIIFFPDAGSQCNDQVTSCYFQTFRLLRAWGYNVLVAWWGQVNKTDHDDIDDYLVKNSSATELPLLSTFQLWQCLNPDVRDNLENNFPEYKLPRVSNASADAPEDTFIDDDDIKIVKMTGALEEFNIDYYQIKVPKEVMTKMPPAPDDFVTPQSVQCFTIEVLMVQADDPIGVETAVDWLLPQSETTTLLGLDCEQGLSGDLNLIQISTHLRCVLIRVPSKSLPHSSSLAKLANILQAKKFVKSGAEVHNDALAIYDTLGLMVNGIKNVSPDYKIMNRTIGMLEIFRTLYGWEWTKKKAITRSDWGVETLTLEQIKYAALDAWASRMIALKQPAASENTVTSLENLPKELLKLFARAIANFGILQRTEKTVFETTGNIFESSRTTLRLVQHNFRSRVTSIGSRVELHFNDGQKPAFFQARTRTGKSVVLTPLSSESGHANHASSSKAPPPPPPASPALPIDVSAISSVIVDNSRSHHPQFRHLREVFYDVLCHPHKCPRLLALALTHGTQNLLQSEEVEEPNTLNLKKKPEQLTAATCSSKTRDDMKGKNLENNRGKNGRAASHPKKSALPLEASQLKVNIFQKVFAPLNDSQGQALHHILTSPLSATIGPPGTGKTRLITAVAKAWLLARGKQEVLLCTAYQNVAARNLAEALTEEQVPGVLLLVSEDYFVDWHESFYEKLAKSVVVTKARCEIPGALEDWRTRNKMSSVPILVCTLGLIGSPAFQTSCQMGGKVTAMVIDECSQAAEGSCIYPLTCLPDLSLLTVLGDPYQLPPFSGSGLKPIKVPGSIFDLVSNGCEVKLLREQYRMPPTICRFISSEIYDNELQTASQRWQQGDWPHPLLWVDVPGTSTKDPGSTSTYNTAEAQAILQVCQKLMKSSCFAEKSMVVLTLYEEQKRRISTLLDAEKVPETRVSVHNVDSFQGQQSDIVLISLVAGKHFSPFAAGRHRACVMLTRVKRFLCVCGNYEAVRWNPQALLWKSLADFCGAQSLVVALEDAEPLLLANMLSTTALQ